MRIVMYIYDDFVPIEVFGPYNLLSRLPNAHVDLVAEKEGVVYSNDKNVSLNVTQTIDTVECADILIVPGSVIGWTQQVRNKAVLRWIRKIDSVSEYTLGLCSGSVILAAAGVLKGRSATTFWLLNYLLEDYEARFIDQPIVQDGKYFTAEAAEPSMELAKQLVREIGGEQEAKVVQLVMGYDDKDSQFQQLKQDKVMTKMTSNMLIEESKSTLSVLNKIINAKLLLRLVGKSRL